MFVNENVEVFLDSHIYPHGIFLVNCFALRVLRSFPQIHSSHHHNKLYRFEIK